MAPKTSHSEQLPRVYVNQNSRYDVRGFLLAIQNTSIVIDIYRLSFLTPGEDTFEVKNTYYLKILRFELK